MAFRHKVKITVRSVIEDLDARGLVSGEREENEEKSIGELSSVEGGGYLITYSTVAEGIRTQTRLTVTDTERVRLTRDGGVVSEMEFCLKEDYKTVYSVPPYSFDMTISTKRLEVDLSELGGSIRLNYEMTIGGQSRVVRMTVKAERGATANGA